MKVLFRLENLYDQPDTDLKCLFENQPSLEELAVAMGTTFPHEKDEVTMAIVKVWQGEYQDVLGTGYTLKDIEFGQVW